MGFKLSTHNGKVTIVNPATGNWRTFRIRTQKPGQWAEGKRVVGLLTGPQNTSDYQNFGFLEGGQIRVWKRYQGTDFETYAKMLMHPSQFIEKGAEYMVEGHCIRCNRLLTVPSSIESGIGPVCAGMES